jgi:hypothetical protein
MRKGELLTQFYARTGLGRAQIATMSKDQITAFVAQADRNNAEEGVVRGPQTFSAPQSQPQQQRPTRMALVG